MPWRLILATIRRNKVQQMRRQATHLQDLPKRILSEQLKNVKQLSSEACLFKVHERLRKPNPEAYTPLTISIGPYHHGKPELRKMERLKVLYTQSLLNRAGGVGVGECWKKLKELEGKAKSYYGDDILKVRGDEFVKMLLLDGCFIVEFVIRQSGLLMMQKRIFDPIFMQIQGMVCNILRDMLLLENQLPFFVLQALYDMISNPGNPEFSEMVKIAFRNKIPKMNIISLLNTQVNPQEIKHLLQIVHILCQPQNNGQIQKQKTCSSNSSCCFWKQPQGQAQDGSVIESHSLSNGQDRRQFFTCFLSKFWEQPQQSIGDEDAALLCSIRTASELQEAGVRFKKVGKISNTSSNQTISLFDIKFNHGVLEIPSFALYHPTETFFRNLIAYEQHSPDVHPMYFTDYAKFMDDLINTEKDGSTYFVLKMFL